MNGQPKAIGSSESAASGQPFTPSMADIERLGSYLLAHDIQPERITEEQAMRFMSGDETALAGFDNASEQAEADRASHEERDIPPSDRVGVGKRGKDAEVVSGPRSPRDARLTADLANLYLQLGMVISMFNKVDGYLIMSGCEDRAKELVAVANHHPQMKKALKQMTTGNDYIALALGHGAIVFAIAANHNIIPGNLRERMAGMFKPNEQTSEQ